VVWHHSLPLINSFNKTEAAVFSCRLCFLRAFPFISLLCPGRDIVLSACCVVCAYFVFNINDVKKEVVNNVDMSSLRAP